jgi:hypothetical protein
VQYVVSLSHEQALHIYPHLELSLHLDTYASLLLVVVVED